MTPIFRQLPILMLPAMLAACEPPLDGPAHACPEISEQDYQAAITAGAASARASLSADGIGSVSESGSKQCVTYQTALKTCRRPVDFVIRYTLADGMVRYVRVAKGEAYRFNIHARPTSCEIIASR